MTLKEAIKRIEELERKVKELEARPQHLHFHSPAYPVACPVYIPLQPILPLPYQPYSPWPIGPTWTAQGAACDNLLTFNG